MAKRPMLLREWAPGKLISLPQPSDKGWPAFNPSLCATKTGWALVLRTANYMLGRYADAQTPNDEHIYLQAGTEFPETQSFFLTFDPQWNLKSCFPLRDEEQRARRVVLGTGLEDIRLFRWQGRWWGLASCASFTPRNRNVMGLFPLTADGAVGEGLLLHSPVRNEREKNWAPFVGGDEVYFLYSTKPWVVLRLDQKGGGYEEVAGWDRKGESWSGSSQWIPWGTGWLGVLHRREKQLSYVHKLVFMDETLYPVRESPEFVFLHWGVEFCAGLARREGRVAFSFGLGDRWPYVWETTEDCVEAIFAGGPK